MNINWRVRFKNKTWLLTFVAAVVGFVYQILAMFGIAPPVSEESVIQIFMTVVEVLAVLGVLIDPTTAGTGDSRLAMTYVAPKRDI